MSRRRIYYLMRSATPRVEHKDRHALPAAAALEVVPIQGAILLIGAVEPPVVDVGIWWQRWRGGRAARGDEGRGCGGWGCGIGPRDGRAWCRCRSRRGNRRRRRRPPPSWALARVARLPETPNRLWIFRVELNTRIYRDAAESAMPLQRLKSSHRSEAKVRSRERRMDKTNGAHHIEGLVSGEGL